MIKNGYIIIGLTGCSCSSCKEDIFIDGIYDTIEEAYTEQQGHYRRKTIPSQYSDTGDYTIRKIEYEVLPDERVIIDDRFVFVGRHIRETGFIVDELRFHGKELNENDIIKFMIEEDSVTDEN